MRRLMMMFLLCGFIQAGSALAAPKKVLPRSFSLKGLQEGTLSRAEFGKGYTLVQFWASWCTSCGTTLAGLAEWTAKNPQIRLVSLSVDEDMKSARRYFSAGPAKLRPLQKFAYFDAGAKVAEALGVGSLPAVYLISPKGEVVQDLSGHPDEAALSKALKVAGNAGRSE